MVVERLEAYKAWPRTGSFPDDHIIFYRNGCGESLYGMVKDEELPMIRGAFTNITGVPRNRAPKVTPLVVGKRHNARFFLYDAN
ncbi:1f9f9995-ecec-4071-90a6-b7dbd413a0d0 [Sclerotinia trifoliorum]|uniref:1f9f9995-ecec-4071-90a6-b7dbd413a0d0 n=1 Tax=Sclerotinia trifoliorum TaxID=28548 RepID=A0A8H2W449_9HELO|nr:1f9f9995-ecec-4071-90a6-b7dbd413a0d0 [Sclerotinia trifoliorum]